MVAHDYRCRTCDAVFEVRAGMFEPAAVVRCPAGHDEVSRVWSAVAVVGSAAPAGSSGGCCGGGCCS